MNAFDPSGWLKMTPAERDELVRPYYSDYLKVREKLDTEKRYPYNSAFTNQIPDIGPESGTTSRDQETGIYLLQQLHTRTVEGIKLAAFIAQGARQIFPDDAPYAVPSQAPEGYPHRTVMRGTVAVVGRYNGETGYHMLTDVRVVRHGFRGHLLAALEKGKRTHAKSLCLESGARVYFLEAGK